MPLRNRKPSANPHDKRHENGLAEPARRIAKQRSDANLAGNALDTASSSPKLTPVDPALTIEEESFPSLAGTGLDVEADGSRGSNTPSEMEAPLRGARDGCGEDSAEQTSDENVGASNAESQGTVQFVVGDHATKEETISTGATFDPARVFLGPHSIRDVIAVLIFLLQLPAPMLIAVQLVFVILTLSNSSSNWTLSSLTSPSEWFHSYGGNPSLMVIVVADLAFATTWYVLSNLLPSWSCFVLDLAQAVIAMSLFGGGTAFRGGWSHSTICFLIVALPHIFKNINWKTLVLDPTLALLSRTGFESSKLSRLTSLHSLHDSSHHWIRLLLEIHIITQGIVRVVRRATLPKGDFELLHASNGLLPSTEVSGEGAKSTSSDGRPPGPPPANKEIKEKLNIGKRRRRQSNFIRSQQPFWASVASGKISITKDVEQAHIQRDAFEANSDKTIVEDAKREGLQGRVWITRIDPTEISFSAVWTDSTTRNDEEAGGDSQGEMHGLRIRLNNALWRHFECREEKNSNGIQVISGKIYGLTPGEKFVIEFLGAEGKVIYSAQIVTRQVALSETTTPSLPLPAPVQDPLRPSSPTTTLKKSIQASENQLTDARSRLKKNRKEHRTANSKLEREVDGLEAKFTAFSGTDDRQRQRQTQFRQNIKQVEDATLVIASQIDSLSELPESERLAHEAKRRKWQEERDRRNTIRQDFDQSRTENERRMQNARNDNLTLKQKRERLEARLARLDQQKDALVSANSSTREEKAAWDTQRANVLNAYKAREQEIINNLQYVLSQREQLQSRVSQIEQQNYFFESSFQSGGAQSPSNHTPEAAYSSLSPNNRGLSAYNGYSSFGYSSGTPPVEDNRHTPINRGKQRGRSSSMLSDVSGFTDAETGQDSMADLLRNFQPQTEPGFSIPRNTSAGSPLVGAIAPPPGLERVGINRSGSVGHANVNGNDNGSGSSGSPIGRFNRS